MLAWTPVTCFDSLPTMPFSGPGNGREKERGCGKGLAWGQGCRSNDRPLQQNAAHTRGRVDYSDLVLDLRCYPPPRTQRISLLWFRNQECHALSRDHCGWFNKSSHHFWILPINRSSRPTSYRSNSLPQRSSIHSCQLSCLAMSLLTTRMRRS